jgi:putative lipoprotein
MISACRYIFTAAMILVIADTSGAGENDGDRWFAKDKIQHFGYSAFLSSGSTIIAHRHFDRNNDDSIIIGIGFSISLGAVKEAIDYRRPGQTSSVRDFIWDIAGAVSGSLLASLAL